MKLLMIGVIFFLMGGFFIISNEKLKLNNRENFHYFTESYVEWLNSLFKNFNFLVSYMIKTEWLPPYKTKVNETSDLRNSSIS